MNQLSIQRLVGDKVLSLCCQLGRKNLEDKIASEREELRKRHEREWKEMDVRISIPEFDNQAKNEQERKLFEDRLPLLRRRAACQLMAMRQRLLRQQNQLEAQTSTALRKFITNAFPLLNGTYQIGEQPQFI